MLSNENYTNYVSSSKDIEKTLPFENLIFIKTNFYILLCEQASLKTIMSC